MRRVTAKFGDSVSCGIWRVTDLEALAANWRPDLNFLVATSNPEEQKRIDLLKKSGLTNIDWIEATEVRIGDIISPNSNLNSATVLYRLTDKHHSIQLTNRCNSNCLMCSQPPTKNNDDWMAMEAIEVVRHMADSPRTIGLSGGEPLLLGPQLRDVLDCVGTYHPSTHVEVLTNARFLASAELSKVLLDKLPTPTTWLVPLYGHTDFLHDFVVQAHGAYEQTIEGLLNLQSYSQPIQLRIVLIQPTLEILPELCTFIGRNLPFVREVALMACEPIGFALANRELCEVDIRDWHDCLKHATRQLKRYAVPFIFMNTPLCTLPENLRCYAHQSISDWKNVYTTECQTCNLKSECAGFFAWHERGWKPSKTIKFIEEKLT